MPLRASREGTRLLNRAGCGVLFAGFPCHLPGRHGTHSVFLLFFFLLFSFFFLSPLLAGKPRFWSYGVQDGGWLGGNSMALASGLASYGFWHSCTIP